MTLTKVILVILSTNHIGTIDMPSMEACILAATNTPIYRLSKYEINTVHCLDRETGVWTRIK